MYYQLPLVNTTDLIGRTFLTEREDGQKHRARIVAAVEDHNLKIEKNPDRMKFLCSVNDDKYEEIMTYNEIINHIEQSEEDDAIVWKFKRIIEHEGPLSKTHAKWKGSTYNLRIEWENGEITDEPMTTIAADDPVTCAIYAKDNDLLDVPGWKRFKPIAKRQQHMFRMANQAKLRSFRLAPKYKYGFEIPRNYDHGLELDLKNGTTHWKDATQLEMTQLDEYDCFQDKGAGSEVPSGFKKIRVHLIYDIKHDGRHKARLVADGHLTDIPIDSMYSGVVTLRGLRLLIFLAELNSLQTWATDIGNAYLEALTSEKVCIIAGPEFGKRQGHLLIIYKALYGLRSSGARWHDRFSDCLRAEGFIPCKAEPDIWLRPRNGVYEYIAVYVDDLAIAMADPQTFVNTLEDKHQFKLKGTGPISFHLGCDFFRDEEGVLCMAPRKYIEKMMMSYESMFGEKPSNKIHSPLEKGSTRMVSNSTNPSSGHFNGPFLLVGSISQQQSCPFPVSGLCPAVGISNVPSVCAVTSTGCGMQSSDSVPMSLTTPTFLLLTMIGMPQSMAMLWRRCHTTPPSH
jgi:Reverse transcriptase (RNA-dependent DNA polymerase)